MTPMKILVNGLPGNMARNTVSHAVRDSRFDLIPYSLTGPEIDESVCTVDGIEFDLIMPRLRDDRIQDIIAKSGPFISIDYTHPGAVNANAEFYCRHDLPFVMGTTGGDRSTLEATVRSASIPAVIAPNMAKQIVGFQAMMEWAAAAFPGLFEGYTLKLKESHQQGKADTSGTAKAMIGYFNRLGIAFRPDEIDKERNPEIQKKDWGIPAGSLSGHGWHTYTLVSEDETVKFEFIHNVNGRDVYACGTLDAVAFLFKKVASGDERGRVYSMIDVLKGNGL